jgi:hypothetical protein
MLGLLQGMLSGRRKRHIHRDHAKELKMEMIKSPAVDDRERSSQETRLVKFCSVVPAIERPY